MNNFVKEFKNNIPYIADEVRKYILKFMDKEYRYEPNKLSELKEELELGLGDWLNEYQLDMNNLKEDITGYGTLNDELFNNREFEDGWGQY